MKENAFDQYLAWDARVESEQEKDGTALLNEMIQSQQLRIGFVCSGDSFGALAAKLKTKGATSGQCADLKRVVADTRRIKRQADQEKSSELDTPPRYDTQHTWYNDKERFAPAVLGGWIKNHYYIKLGEDGLLYKYNGTGLYQPCEDWLNALIIDIQEKDWKRDEAEEVIKWLSAQIPVSSLPNEKYINCRNGLLNWRTLVVERHTPSEFFTTQVQADWDPEAVCPVIDRFLSAALPYDGGVGLAWKIVGYILHNGARSFQKAFLCEGDGGNGKSRYLDIIRGLLGPSGYSTRSLNQLVTDRFASADLYGKCANVCGDIDVGLLESTDIFKQLTGEDPVNGQHKFKRSFDFLNRAVPIFSANGFPTSRDKSSGWFDRWIVLPFPIKFRGVVGTEDTELKSKLLAQSEMNGALRQAVMAYRKLREERLFSEPAASLEAKSEFIRRSNSAVEFLHEHYTCGGVGWVLRALLWADYKKWCGDSERKAVQKSTFNEIIAAQAGVTLERTNAYGWGWRGLDEKKPEDEEPAETVEDMERRLGL